jgi:hypothetical protein
MSNAAFACAEEWNASEGTQLQVLPGRHGAEFHLIARPHKGRYNLRWPRINPSPSP